MNIKEMINYLNSSTINGDIMDTNITVQNVDSDTKLYQDNIYKFQELFNRNTGEYVRNDSKETNSDSFMRSFPVLLDIGIMGGCKSCNVCKADCYQGGKPYNPEKDMKIEDYKKIIDEGSKKGLQQIALGGAGNPNDHKDFEEILKYTKEHDIIPNYTTSGIELTDKAVQLTKKYCGAVAVSWYYQQFTVDALNKFIKSGMKTSIHFVLSKKSIDDAINILENHTLTYIDKEGTLKVYKFDDKSINAVIFLLYKPVGRGSKDNILTIDKDNEKIIKFFSLVGRKHPFKIGFDSCSIPAVIRYSDNIEINSVDSCEGGRFSAYINANMIMTPCSFDQSLKYGVPLKDNTIENVWNSDKFTLFRSKLGLSCIQCKNRKECLGGCPLTQEIVLCNSKFRNHNVTI